MPSLNPSAFRDTPLCELCFEDALKAGSKRSEGLTDRDFHPTSIRFCIDGLYKWLKSYTKNYGGSSVFAITRDISWWWSSFCSNDPVFSALVKEYYSLLKDITENTSYTRYADRMDEAGKIKEIGWHGKPFNLVIPFECHGIIADCATALGMSFSVLYQLGVAKALSSNSHGLYASWAKEIIQPLFDEVMGRATSRLEDFIDIRENVDSRMKRQGLHRSEE